MIDETVSDNTSDVDVSDTSTDDSTDTDTTGEAPVITPLSIDDLLGIEGVPEFESEENHTGMKPLADMLKHVHPDVRKHLANIRGDYSRKTQELAAERARLAQVQQSIEAEKQALYSGEFANKLRELTADETQHDVFDPEGMQAEIRKQAAALLQEMIKPMQEDLTVSQRRAELTEFKAANPDLVEDADIKAKTAEILRAREDLKLEDAYYIAKAHVLGDRQLKQRAEAASQRASQRDTLLATSTGSAASGGAPRFKSAVEAYKYHLAKQGK